MYLWERFYGIRERKLDKKLKCLRTLTENPVFYTRNMCYFIIFFSKLVPRESSPCGKNGILTFLINISLRTTHQLVHFSKSNVLSLLWHTRHLKYVFRFFLVFWKNFDPSKIYDWYRNRYFLCQLFISVFILYLTLVLFLTNRDGKTNFVLF